MADGPAPDSLTPADAIDVAELRKAFAQAVIYLSMVVGSSGISYLVIQAA